MKHKDNENEGIGIIAIIVLAVLAVIGLYFLFSHHPPAAVKPESESTVPLETPSPVHRSAT